MSLTVAPEAPPLRVDEHGVCRVAGTRVTLETILDFHRRGWAPERIHDEFPTVPLPAVYATVAFALSHPDQVSLYLEAAERQAEAVRKQIEAKQPQTGLRDQLLARRGRVHS